MASWVRRPEQREGDWLTTCAFHPFTFYSSETFIDDMGRVRCKRFCSGLKTTRQMDQVWAQTRRLREAPAPPNTRPRNGGVGYERPYASWDMRANPAVLLDPLCGHDGRALPLLSPAPNVKVVTGRAGQAFQFGTSATDKAVGYEVVGSAGANAPQIGIAAWVGVPTFSPAGAGKIVDKLGATDGFRLSIDAATVKLALGATTISAPVEVGVWSHLAATFDGATATLYVNGASAATGAATLRANVVPLTIGVDLVAQMYGLRYYQRSFDTTELGSIMGPGGGEAVAWS